MDLHLEIGLSTYREGPARRCYALVAKVSTRPETTWECLVGSGLLVYV